MHQVYGTFTPTTGSASQFLVAQITVECVVQSVIRPADPTEDLTYTLWIDDPVFFDVTQTWT